jgi:hypothetical protein
LVVFVRPDYFRFRFGYILVVLHHLLENLLCSYVIGRLCKHGIGFFYCGSKIKYTHTVWRKNIITFNGALRAKSYGYRFQNPECQYNFVEKKIKEASRDGQKELPPGLEVIDGYTQCHAGCIAGRGKATFGPTGYKNI